MKKLVPISLFALLLYHTLAYVLVCLSIWWQAEHDLTERLLVYRSIDSLVEFQIPLQNKPEARVIARTTSDGFRYRDHYYSVVSLDVRSDTVYIVGLAVKSQAGWPTDLLSFLNDHLLGSDSTHHKANQLLKFLLKEYSPTPRAIFRFCQSGWRDAIRMPNVSFRVVTRSLSVHSPPPEA